jgi:uncharacterized protein YggE
MSFLDIVASHGIDHKDYSASSVKIVPIYVFQNGSNVLIGQRASMSWLVKVREILNDTAAIGFLIEDVSQIDGISVNGISFHI